MATDREVVESIVQGGWAMPSLTVEAGVRELTYGDRLVIAAIGTLTMQVKRVGDLLDPDLAAERQRKKDRRERVDRWYELREPYFESVAKIAKELGTSVPKQARNRVVSIASGYLWKSIGSDRDTMEFQPPECGVEEALRNAKEAWVYPDEIAGPNAKMQAVYSEWLKAR